jgi:hypothetical protein
MYAVGMVGNLSAQAQSHYRRANDRGGKSEKVSRVRLFKRSETSTPCVRVTHTVVDSMLGTVPYIKKLLAVV